MKEDKKAIFSTVKRELEGKAVVNKRLVDQNIQPEHVVGEAPKDKISHTRSAQTRDEVPAGE